MPISILSYSNIVFPRVRMKAPKFKVKPTTQNKTKPPVIKINSILIQYS